MEWVQNIVILHAQIQRARQGDPDWGGGGGGGGGGDGVQTPLKNLKFRNTGMDLPREAIGPKVFNCFSREVCTSVK